MKSKSVLMCPAVCGPWHSKFEISSFKKKN